MDNVNIVSLWRDFKEVMYNLEIEDHIDAVWGFFEDEEVFETDGELLEEARNEGYEQGYEDAESEVSDDSFERGWHIGYDVGVLDGCNH